MKEIELYKLLSDENRYNIFVLLLNKELCICDFESVLQMKQANVSKHMMKFKELGIVDYRKEAQWVYYSLNNEFKKEHPLLIEHIQTKAINDSKTKQMIGHVTSETSCGIKKGEQ